MGGPRSVVAFCFALVAQVAVIEGLKRRGGAPPQRRSGARRLAARGPALGGVRRRDLGARLLADAVVPDTRVFMTQLIGDLLTLAVMPLPLIAAALLYFDLRRRRDRFGDDRLRAALASLRR